METFAPAPAPSVRWGGVLFMLLLASIAAVRWQEGGRIFYALVCFRDLILAGYYSRPSVALVRAPAWQNLFAYGTLVFQMLYFCRPETLRSLESSVVAVANVLAVMGMFLATLAAIELGSQFSIAPAARGSRCHTGVYRYVRHPMYLGYGIAEFGWVLLDIVNLPIYFASMWAQYMRTRMEERVLRHSR